MKRDFKILLITMFLSSSLLFSVNNYGWCEEKETGSEKAAEETKADEGEDDELNLEDIDTKDPTVRDVSNTPAQFGSGCPDGNCSQVASADDESGCPGGNCSSAQGMGMPMAGGGGNAMASMLPALMSMLGNNNTPAASSGSTAATAPTATPITSTYASSATTPSETNSTTGKVAVGNTPYYTPLATASSSLNAYQSSLPTEVPLDDMGCSEAADKALFILTGKHAFDYASTFEMEETGQVTITSDDWKKILNNDMGMTQIFDATVHSSGAPAGYTDPHAGDTILIDRADGTAHIMMIGEGAIIDQRQRPISQEAFAEEINAGDHVTIWRDDRYFSNATASLIDGSEYNELNANMLN